MTRKEWTIIGVLGTAVVVVFACMGCLILAILPATSRQADQVAISDLPSVTPLQLSTPVSATQVKPTTPPQPTAQRTATALPTATPIPPATKIPPTAIPAPVELTFTHLCKQDSSRTAIQVEQELQMSVGKTITDWQGWVYDVSQTGTSYTIEVGMDDPSSAILWTRDIEIVGISKDLAFQLKKQQMVTFSGTIKGYDNAFGVYCNPLTIEKATVK